MKVSLGFRGLSLGVAAMSLMAGSLRAFEMKTQGHERRARSFTAGRSKYTPHIGNKERARHAGKPDGPMHGLPLLRRA